MQRAVLLGLVLMAVTPAAAAEPEPEQASLFDVLRESTASVDLRYRYEWVSDDAVGLDGHASTLRTALSYETGAYEASPCSWRRRTSAASAPRCTTTRAWRIWATGASTGRWWPIPS